METSCKNLVKENYDWKGDNNGSNQLTQRFGGMDDRGDNDIIIMDDEPLAITEMPDSIFLHIFSYLPFSSIGSVAQVCQRWSMISCDELLWKGVFLRHYKLSFDTKYPAKANSWRSEFKRLYYHTPCLLSEERKEHRDEVLHISFSHDGTMFATCSKDGFFKVWEFGQPCRLLFEKDMMSSFSWKFTQFSQFNESDTCLLVSGVYFGSLSTSGEIAVFNLLDGFNMQCRVTNKPYDVFGAWYDNDHLLSGTLYITSGDFRSVSAVWLSKASQEVESEMESVSMVLYRFENRNSSSIRLLHVAEVERDDEDNIEHEKNCCPEISHSPHASMEQGENDVQPLPSSSEIMGMDKGDNGSHVATDVPAGLEFNVAVGGTDQAAGCDSKLLDKLLRKSIAENEFDLENEDDTDNEIDVVNAESPIRTKKAQSSRSRSSSHGNQMTTEEFDNFANVNFISFGEPQSSLNSFESHVSNLQEVCKSDSHSPLSGQVHGNASLKCLDNLDKGLPLKKSKWSVVHSTNSSNSSSEGVESCSSSGGSGSSSFKALSGGFDGLGINNSNVTSNYCDDCPMEEDDESEVRWDKIVVVSNEQCKQSSSSTACSVMCDSSVDLLSTNEDTCDRCGEKGNPHACGSDRSSSSLSPIDRFGFEKQHIGSSNEGDGYATSSNDRCDKNTGCGIEDNYNITAPNKSAISDYDIVFDNSTSSGANFGNSNGISSTSNARCDHDNDNNEMNFHDDVTEQGGVDIEHELEKSFLSACSNKVMGDAATQTEDSSVSQASSVHSSMVHMSHSMSHSSSLSREAAPRRATDKLLIYTWGSETYIPHKIGIKHMKRSDFCKGEVKTRQSSMLLPDVMENLHNVTEDKRDSPDISIDMHGHIVGLSLSPDNKFLYVNCRAWPQNYIIVDPQECPPLAQQVEIFTIDLKTFEFVGPVLRSHKAYTHSDECFFLNLDVSDDYVVSGAEDRKGYIWDRHYGICLGQFEHRNVVNCMAARPHDPEVAVSVSDDHTFKVWASRHRLKEAEKMGKSANQITHRNSIA